MKVDRSLKKYILMFKRIPTRRIKNPKYRVIAIVAFIFLFLISIMSILPMQLSLIY